MSTPDPATTKWVPLASPGGGVDYIGTWAVGTTYKAGDVVRHLGIDYIAVNPSTGQTPVPATPPPLPRVIIPIRLRVPRSSTLGGNAAFSVTALTAWDMAAWEFADAVEGRIYGHCRTPPALAAVPDAKVVVVMAASVAGNVVNTVKVHGAVGGGSLNPAALAAAYGPTTRTLSAGYGIYETGILLASPTTGALTLAPSQTLIFEITRFGADGADTLAGTQYILDAYLEVNVA